MWLTVPSKGIWHSSCTVFRSLHPFNLFWLLTFLWLSDERKRNYFQMFRAFLLFDNVIRYKTFLIQYILIQYIICSKQMCWKMQWYIFQGLCTVLQNEFKTHNNRLPPNPLWWTSNTAPLRSHKTISVPLGPSIMDSPRAWLVSCLFSFICAVVEAPEGCVWRTLEVCVVISSITELKGQRSDFGVRVLIRKMRGNADEWSLPFLTWPL